MISVVMLFVTFLHISSHSLSMREADSLFEAGLMECRFNRNTEKAAAIFNKLIGSADIDNYLRDAAKRSLEMCNSTRSFMSLPTFSPPDSGREKNLLLFRDKSIRELVAIYPCGSDAIILAAGMMFRLSPNGRKIWSTDISALPLLADSDEENICLAESADAVSIFSATDGNKHWRRRFYSTVSSVALSRAHGLVLILLRSGRLTACSVKDGSIVWSADVPRGSEMKIRGIVKDAVVVSASRKYSYSISVPSGELLWSISTNTENSLAKSGRFFMYGGNSLQSIEIESGRQQWTVNFARTISGVLHDENKGLIVETRDGKIVHVNEDTGKLSVIADGFLGTKLIACYRNRIILADGRGRIFALDAKGKHIWDFGIAEQERLECVPLRDHIAVYSGNNGFFILNPYNSFISDKRIITDIDKIRQLVSSGVNELALKTASSILEEYEPANSYASITLAQLYQKRNEREKAFSSWDFALKYADARILEEEGVIRNINKLAGAKWSYLEPDAMRFGAFSSYGSIITVPCNGSLLLLDVENGTRRSQQLNFSGKRVLSAHILNDTISVVNVESELIVYDMRKNKTMWKHDLQSSITSCIYKDGILWVGTWENGVILYDLFTGRIAGSYMNDAKGVHIFNYGGNVICIGLDGIISGFSGKKEVFRSRSREPFLPVFAHDFSGNLFTAATSDGSVECVSALDGRIKWKIESAAQTVSLSSSNGTTASLLADGSFMLIKSDDGKVMWANRYRGQAPEQVVNTGIHVVTAGNDRITFHRLSDGITVRSMRTAGRIATVAYVGNTLLARLENGLISAYIIE